MKTLTDYSCTSVEEEHLSECSGTCAYCTLTCLDVYLMFTRMFQQSMLVLVQLLVHSLSCSLIIVIAMYTVVITSLYKSISGSIAVLRNLCNRFIQSDKNKLHCIHKCMKVALIIWIYPSWSHEYQCFFFRRVNIHTLQLSQNLQDSTGDMLKICPVSQRN